MKIKQIKTYDPTFTKKPLSEPNKEDKKPSNVKPKPLPKPESKQEPKPEPQQEAKPETGKKINYII